MPVWMEWLFNLQHSVIETVTITDREYSANGTLCRVN